MLIKLDRRIRWFWAVLGAIALLPRLSLAVERSLVIEAPRQVAVGAPLQIVISASTNAGSGERIGFFHVEFSREPDGEWVPLAYMDNIGETQRQEFTLPSDKRGEVRVRARVAFRDGLAGDVDRSGAAMRWHSAWAKWQEPTACYAIILVGD